MGNIRRWCWWWWRNKGWKGQFKKIHIRRSRKFQPQTTWKLCWWHAFEKKDDCVAKKGSRKVLRLATFNNLGFFPPEPLYFFAKNSSWLGTGPIPYAPSFVRDYFFPAALTKAFHCQARLLLLHSKQLLFDLKNFPKFKKCQYRRDW